jgi:hypothetical protein
MWSQPRINLLLTGATGLEPATSGVTGRSWRLRVERGYAWIAGYPATRVRGVGEVVTQVARETR